VLPAVVLTGVVLPDATVCAATQYAVAPVPAASAVHAAFAVATRVPKAQLIKHDAAEVPAPAATVYPLVHAVQAAAAVPAASQVFAAQLPHAALVLP